MSIEEKNAEPSLLDFTKSFQLNCSYFSALKQPALGFGYFMDGQGSSQKYPTREKKSSMCCSPKKKREEQRSACAVEEVLLLLPTAPKTPALLVDLEATILLTR